MRDPQVPNKDEPGVWPPAPSFRPLLTKPPTPLPPLWVVLLINGVCGLLLAAFHVYNHWSHDRSLDWKNAAFMGLTLFLINTGVQLWVRRQARRAREDRAAQSSRGADPEAEKRPSTS